MTTYRLGEVITLRKTLAIGSSAVVESDYSLCLKYNGNTQFINSAFIGFTIVQATATVVGTMDATLTVSNVWEDGKYIIELHQKKNTGWTTAFGLIVEGWTSVIGSARFSIEKALITPLTV